MYAASEEKRRDNSSIIDTVGHMASSGYTKIRVSHLRSPERYSVGSSEEDATVYEPAIQLRSEATS